MQAVSDVSIFQPFLDLGEFPLIVAVKPFTFVPHFNFFPPAALEFLFLSAPRHAALPLHHPGQVQAADFR